MSQDGGRKSTLTKDLAEREGAILLVQDELFDCLFLRITQHTGIRQVLFPIEECARATCLHFLSKGISVVLDFPGNTRRSAPVSGELFEARMLEHELHFIDASDALCKDSSRREVRMCLRHSLDHGCGVRSHHSIFSTSIRG